jgi:hypothetical protein
MTACYSYPFKTISKTQLTNKRSKKVKQKPGGKWVVIQR